MRYWEDGTPKSTGNAFDWRGKESQLLKTPELRNSNNARMQMMGTKSKANVTYVTKIKNYGPKPLSDI